eukprot:2253127-Pleurochrysis_carterae.AAC.1
MTAELLHTRFNHRRAEVIKLLPQCTRDAPTSWTTLARKIACGECLHANSDAVHSDAYMPMAKSGGELISYDIYYVSVPHVHGGQQYVINFHDHYSTLNTPYLLARKSDAFSAIKHYIAYCNSHNVTIRRMHNDNAEDLTSKQIREFLLEQGARPTTISPHVPRQNGACERQWRTMARDIRAKLATSKLPVSYWWYHQQAIRKN